MERRDFYDLAEANVRHYMPKEYQDVRFELVETRKMNDVKVTGLKARVPGWTMEPIVYLDSYYEQYAKSLDGTSAVTSLANDMLAVMERAKANDFATVVKPGRGIYEHIRDKLEIKLCGVENNERFLAGRPHTVVGDFAATYAFGLEEERASGLVMNGFLEDEGISLERLHADALAAEASRGIALYYMSDIMDNLLAGDEPRNILASGKLPEDMPDSPVEMYVLTNERRHFGASAILQGDALRRVGEILGGDYVVLPSSVHEVIIVPAEEMGVTSQECRAMVREINDTTVRPEERLSDKVQYYDVANERLVGYEEYEREREQTPLKTARDILLDQGDLYGFVPYTIPRTCREDGGEFPEDMQKYAYGLSVMKGVKYPVVMAIVEVESGYKADAMRETGEVGYMQLIELWHGDSMKKLGCRDLAEPTGNLLVGINFLKRMLVEHGGDYGMALTAYRYGSDGAKRNFFSKGETTCEYAQKVLDVAARIEGELERTRQIQADGKNAGMTPEERGGKENGRNPESGRDGKVPNGKLRHAPTASTPRL